MEEISEETKADLAKFQSYQQQLQSILIQKESLRLQNLEIDAALRELERTEQKSAYKITGEIMILKPVDELKRELNEAKENIRVRMESLEKVEKRTLEKLKELQERLKGVMGAG